MTNYKPHIFSLFALFMCGNAIITLPFFNTKSPFVTLFITAIISALLVVFSVEVIKFAQKNKFSFFALRIFIGLLAIFGAITTIFDYVSFVSKIQLPQANIILLVIAMIIITIFFALCSGSAFLKYCLFTGVFFVAIVVILFVCGIKHFDFSHVSTTSDTNFAMIFLRLFSGVSAPVLLMFLQNKVYTKVMVSGAVFGFCLVFLCLAQSILTLGATPVSYPYIKAVSVISTGSLFTRLDGLVYFLFFVSAIVKITVCIKTLTLKRQ